MPRITYVCECCESTNIIVPAHARWSEAKQAWEFESLHDDQDAYCYDCDTHMHEVSAILNDNALEDDG